MLYLHGIGHFHPRNEISNAFLEQLDIGTNDEWIVERTGIRSRRTVLPLCYITETRNRDVRMASEAADYSNAELGKRAAEMALERAGIDRSEIGLLVGGGSVSEYETPAEGCSIAAALDLDVPAFDLRSACTSFGAMLWTLSLMRPDSLPRFVLMVCPETVTRSVDYTDRAAAVLWGDAAVAAVVSTVVPGRTSIVGNTFASNPRGHEKVTVPRAGYFGQQGKAVQGFAIRHSVQLLSDLQQKYDGHDEGDGGRFFYIGHQANLRMIENVSQRCNIAAERHLHNVERFGNTATAGSPSVLSERWERFRPGDDVAMVGVGAGLSWSSAMIRFRSGSSSPAATE